MNSFIVLEGVDGTGKTTVGERLAQELGATYLCTPGEVYRPSRKQVDRSASPEAKLLFYLSSVFDASHQATLLRGTKPVICDRYVWSSLVPHAAYYGYNVEELEQTWNPILSGLTVPSQTVLLRVNEEEQMKRLSVRQEMTASDAYCQKESLRKRARQFFDYIAERDGWVIVNTDNKGIDAVVNEVLERTVGVLA